MKTELGVGVAVLSALAAQGKDFDRAGLSAMEIGYGVRQMHIDKAFHGIYTTGGGLGTKMGVYVKESDYEQAWPIAERIMQGESLASRSRIG